MSTTITASCGHIYDTAGKLLRIGESALTCVLPRGHAGAHDCAYVARLTIANTGTTRPRDIESMSAAACRAARWRNHEPR